MNEVTGEPDMLQSMGHRVDMTAAWWAAIYGVAQSQTRLKQLNSSSSNNN